MKNDIRRKIRVKIYGPFATQIDGAQIDNTIMTLMHRFIFRSTKFSHWGCWSFLLCVTTTSCSSPDIQKITGPAQATQYHISWWAAESIEVEQLTAEINQEFTRLDQLLSNYRADSVIEKFNANHSMDSFEVGEEIVSLLTLAQGVYKASYGCYDPTIKPVFELWGFIADQFTQPSDDALQAALANVGMKYLEIVDNKQIRKLNPLLQVDLSSISQGYSVARIAALLERHGIKNYLVEIGGELQVRGHKPDDQPWRVAIERPLPGEQRMQKIITIENSQTLAINTSGTYRHFFDNNGKRYSHIIDARTGRPVEHATVSVTTLLADSTLSDAWATALLCLGTQEGLPVAEDNNIAALFLEQKAIEQKAIEQKAFEHSGKELAPPEQEDESFAEFSSLPLRRLNNVKVE